MYGMYVCTKVDVCRPAAMTLWYRTCGLLACRSHPRSEFGSMRSLLGYPLPHTQVQVLLHYTIIGTNRHTLEEAICRLAFFGGRVVFL